ncbi:serine O-acetyltransferase [Helicobacter sp. MIT 14-3879]|uniref:serine O-acetyltransferase n=1 Tax=Helicobacter sp. MIT 14-3879 TaxID=2040649 RepID=UPI000E1F8518|nr:serine O-acetyltransferase [Helicobacter sp. MIT 14-3879]RDU65018.1 serine O-acetyltransferase [Helicobacter sp. MIT 14-3879]
MSLFTLIKEDFKTIRKKDPAINSNVELFFNYPGLIAIVHYRIANKLYKKNFRILARIIMGFTQFITNIDIHPACSIGRGIFIDHGIGVVIGETAILEDNITIYQGVTLGGVSLDKVKRHPTILSGVVIGAGAKILGNITIGENAKVGANSVVIKDVPANSTAVGIPAKVIQKGRIQDSSAINKLPDIDAQMFNYLLKKIEILEYKLNKNYKEEESQKEKLKELDRIYESFIKTIKNN